MSEQDLQRPVAVYRISVGEKVDVNVDLADQTSNERACLALLCGAASQSRSPARFVDAIAKRAKEMLKP